MAWSTVPVSGGAGTCPNPATDDKVLKAQFDEVRAAILERLSAIGSALTVTAATADGSQALSLLAEYRSRIETLIARFWCESGAWTDKATLFNYLFGRADWLPVLSGDPMREMHINELRLVLNELEWAVRALSASASFYAKTGNATGASWDLSWAATKADYAGEAWAPMIGGADYFAAFIGHAYNDSPFEHVLQHWRVPSVAIAVPDIVVLDAKARFEWSVHNAGSGSVDLFPQADFGGTPVNVASGDAGWFDVPDPAKGATTYWSTRTNPESPAPDSYRPPDVVPEAKGFSADQLQIAVKHQFAYRS